MRLSDSDILFRHALRCLPLVFRGGVRGNERLRLSTLRLLITAYVVGRDRSRAQFRSLDFALRQAGRDLFKQIDKIEQEWLRDEEVSGYSHTKDQLTRLIIAGARAALHCQRLPPASNSFTQAVELIEEKELVLDRLNDVEYRGDLSVKLGDPLWRYLEHVSEEPLLATESAQLAGIGEVADIGYWLEWYKGFYDGTPLDLELQLRIASIGDEIWGTDFPTLETEIKRIQAERLLEQTTLAEDVYYNDETARVARTIIPQARPKAMATILAALRDDLEDASSGNLLSKTSYDYRTLDRMMTKYHLNPERVEMDVVKISASLRRQIDAGDLPDAPEVEGLCSTLVEIGLEIRAQHPEIDEARTKRGAKAV